jgi:pimeloyl-ACP methyl ester carboxylesterase
VPVASLKSLPLKIAVVLVLLVLALAAFWLWTPDKETAVLEAKYLKAPADMIDVAGVRLHVRDSGSKNAPAVVFIHGFGGSLHSWEAWAEGLAATHRVIRFDLPGSGLSSPDPTGDYSDARTMKLLIALMDQLGVTRASIVGHSIGGRMAWTFAATHPQRVNKLVLVSPDGFASPGFVYGSAPEVPATVKLMRWALPKALLKMSLAPAYGDPQFMTDALATRYHDLMLAPGSREALIARMQQTVLVDPLPLLKQIQAPTLLVWGEADGMIPFANSADYLKAIGNVKLAAFKAIGHLPQEEAAAESLKAVADFLR